MFKFSLLATLLISSILLSSCEITIKPLPIPSTTPKAEITTSEPILTFGELASANEVARWIDELGRWKPATAEINGQTKTLSSLYFKNNTIVGRTGTTTGVYLSFEWTAEGAQLSKIITTRLVGKPLGIFAGDEPLRASDGYPVAPTVIEPIIDRGQITGLDVQNATALSKQLNENSPQ